MEYKKDYRADFWEWCKIRDAPAPLASSCSGQKFLKSQLDARFTIQDF